MRRFLYAENGAVSVYLILIIVPIFLFQAVLIDFARIKAAEKESESAVQAASRSVMSSFDSDLQKRGLYGMVLSQENSEQLFSEVFAKNLSSGVTANAFHFIDTKAVDGGMRVTPVYALASHAIFEGQLLEDMKLKGPIEFSLEIADKFQKSGVKAPFQMGSQFAKNAAEVEKLIEQREDALDEAWHSTEVMYARITTFHLYYQKRISDLDAMANRIGLHTIDELRIEINQVKDQLQSLSNAIHNMDLSMSSMMTASPQSIQAALSARSNLEQQYSTLSQKLNDLEALVQLIIQYTALIVSTKLEVAVNERDILQLQQSIEPVLRLAKQKNDDIRAKLTAIGGSSTSTTSDSQGVNDVFQHVSLIGDNYFYDYQISVASIASLFTAFHLKIESIALYTAANTNQANAANDAYWTLVNDFYSKKSSIEKARMDANDGTKAKKQTERNKIQAVLDKAKQAIGGCSFIQSQSNDEALYNKLQGDTSNLESANVQGFYQKYRQVNAQDVLIGNDVAYDLDKAESTSLRAMDILGVITQASEMLRDELYVNEYALTKFNYRTYGLEKDRSGQAKLSNELVDPGSHQLANQEAEYLLYGFSSCAANISSAYAEMFSLRLAIRTVENLLDPEKELLNVGSPLLVLLVAAAQGAVEAFADMNALVKGESVELSSKLSAAILKLTYKDYLRLFLMLHSDNTKLMARMQALIELETGKDLTQAAAYIQTNATSEIRLWFIPQMMKLFNGSDLLGCKVVGTQCQFNRTAIVAY
ncbi:hypothetical protein [Paenibacillus qinlingensis]|uniref:Methyl-accepting chemotaxis protein n=1 Tax=Paenibacillus qinlingensis TaxID=1837343 RepID=A0ABU1NQH1_9BACL|nr:hypothetical protein [Paenibacillus qinlingensis]MDR6549695.1 hypothetical protein [Paenibacillus qinlingensis]